MKTWFIAGASRGFEWTAAALERGDRVASHGDAILPLRWQPVGASAHGAVAR